MGVRLDGMTDLIDRVVVVAGRVVLASLLARLAHTAPSRWAISRLTLTTAARAAPPMTSWVTGRKEVATATARTIAAIELEAVTSMGQGSLRGMAGREAVK